ncbi:hypothetical protein [Streptomyces sp. NPDC046261]|uniref:hypothetical protein n=1 Tax=Streptomyces sp. NPDC046261 TaxID=3157200 RepID=UPI0033F57E01
MRQSTVTSALARRAAVMVGVAATGLISCAEASAQQARPAYVQADNTWGNSPFPRAMAPLASVGSGNTWGN